jgi:Acyl-CoA hydrolase
MEIRIDVSHSEDGRDLVATSYFVFVSRDAASQTKAVPVPQLSFEGEEDIESCTLRYEYGIKNQAVRKNLTTVIHLASP